MRGSFHYQANLAERRCALCTRNILMRLICALFLSAAITGCATLTADPGLLTPTNPAAATTAAPSTLPTTATEIAPAAAAPPDLSAYAFPETIDPAQRYLFYLHGRIIEDQGLPAVSPVYGEYAYGAILESLRQPGFVVIGEQRSQDTQADTYAWRVAGQAQKLIRAGVPPDQITVVGASKGAAITILVSYHLQQAETNYVLLANCHADVLDEFMLQEVSLSGNVLSIYDSVDEYAGSCQRLFAFSQGKALGRHEEIVLSLGIGHALVYQPMDEWVRPTVRWASGDW